MSTQTYEDFLRGQAEKAQYGVVIIPARTALDMADFIERTRANGTDIDVGSVISRQAMIDELMKRDKELRNINWYDKPFAEGECRGIDYALEVVNALPSAQPEIVRCKDCKHYKAYEYTGELACHYVIGGTVVRNLNDFCSRGEKT